MLMLNGNNYIKAKKKRIKFEDFLQFENVCSSKILMFTGACSSVYVTREHKCKFEQKM